LNQPQIQLPQNGARVVSSAKKVIGEFACLLADY
jgi:hypothetical protein